MSNTTDTGLDGFIAGLRRCGIEPKLEANVVTFFVELLAGANAGAPVATGVSADELSGWPAVPPHWVHFPSTVTFGRSNTKASPVAGWSKHSRRIHRWGNATEPAQAWLSHVRAVLDELS